MTSARQVVKELGGRWSSTYGMVPCPLSGHGQGKGDRNPSLKVWDGPDGVRFHCFGGCDWRDVRDELRRRRLLPEAVERRQRRPSRQRQASERRQDPDPGERKRIESARAIWKAARPTGGTVGEAYFRSRAISIELPRSVKFAPVLRHPDTGLDLPAVVLAVQNGAGRVTGIQRIFLKHDGSTKALVSRQKMALGILRGGAVRLGPAGPELGIAEGVENGLSAMQLNSGLPVWCALSVSSLANVVLPDKLEKLHFFLDGDAPGSAAAKAAVSQIYAGREVHVHRPPVGKDWNDVLCQGVEGPLAMGDSNE